MTPLTLVCAVCMVHGAKSVGGELEATKGSSNFLDSHSNTYPINFTSVRTKSAQLGVAVCSL